MKYFMIVFLLISVSFGCERLKKGKDANYRKYKVHHNNIVVFDHPEIPGLKCIYPQYTREALQCNYYDSTNDLKRN